MKKGGIQTPCHLRTLGQSCPTLAPASRSTQRAGVADGPRRRTDVEGP